MTTLAEQQDKDTWEFREWQAAMRRRWLAAQRCQPYRHRPGDRGFNPWAGETA